MSKRQQKRRKARDAKYTIGIDLSRASGDYSAYVVSRQDPVTKAIEIVRARTLPAISEEAREIIRADLQAFGLDAPNAGGRRP